MAIARQRRLLCDELLVALADSSWEILDVSGSDVTDASIEFVAILCHRLQDVDIRYNLDPQKYIKHEDCTGCGFCTL